MIPNGIPDCDSLFEQYFYPQYTEQTLNERRAKFTMEDILFNDSFVGLKARDVCRYGLDYALKQISQIEAMCSAAQSDWPSYLEVEAPVDMSWLDKFDKWFTAPRLIELIDRSDPSDSCSDYVITVCELGSVIGQQMIQLEPSLEWLIDWPYWDSMLFHGETGAGLPVYSWAIRRLSGTSIEENLAHKMRSGLRQLELRSALQIGYLHKTDDT